MGLTRYGLALVALVVVTCGSALPGLTSREPRPAPAPVLLPESTTVLLEPESDPSVASSFAEDSISFPHPSFGEVPPGWVYWKTVTARVTAYDPSYRCCGDSADGKTSTMTNAWKLNGIAVDPDAIPYGTLANIQGIGLRVADDTGAAMRRSWQREGVFHIDVRLKYFYQARNWGVKVLQVPLFRKID